jgi:hypothetical protein
MIRAADSVVVAGAKSSVSILICCFWFKEFCKGRCETRYKRKKGQLGPFEKYVNETKNDVNVWENSVSELHYYTQE